ncbi:hypothetical protein [Scleromatobacter humisilvae]|uniref:Uncharacterized protein n=1 Tax=Scleromatobacter humisilvae TaxID=2897159 RepID=A0A9X2C096_9BURK|nr:hypothetical protein [Scleromatobacter humisilvae]MCK9684469.1 hypothetical protein [Scleromatobacter humisilvae]
MRDWATTRRRRWSASRIAAAIALHALVLAALRLAIDRVEMPRAVDRATTLLTVVLHEVPPPLHALPLPVPARLQPPARASRAPRARPRETEPPAIALPAPAEPTATAVAPPASAPQPDLRFLDGAATRQAIRDAAHGQTLASLGNAITSTGQTSSERLAKDVEAAHKADCMKDAGGMGLLALPVILAAEAMGKCAHKL